MPRRRSRTRGSESEPSPFGSSLRDPPFLLSPKSERARRPCARRVPRSSTPGLALSRGAGVDARRLAEARAGPGVALARSPSLAPSGAPRRAPRPVRRAPSRGAAWGSAQREPGRPFGRASHASGPRRDRRAPVRIRQAWKGRIGLSRSACGTSTRAPALHLAGGILRRLAAPVSVDSAEPRGAAVQSHVRAQRPEPLAAEMAARFGHFDRCKCASDIRF